MPFLSVLLIYTEMVLSSPLTDMLSRGVESLPNLDLRDAPFVVYAADPKNTISLLEVDKFLKDLYGKEHVEFNQAFFSWSVLLQNGETTNALKGHPGIRLGEDEESKRSDVVKSDDLWYIALAANPDDDEQTKATREFLQSKIKNPGLKITELHVPTTKHVLAWGRLQLTSDAKAAVEGYEGIKALGEDSGEPSEDRAVTTNQYLHTRKTPRSN